MDRGLTICEIFPSTESSILSSTESSLKLSAMTTVALSGLTKTVVSNLSSRDFSVECTFIESGTKNLLKCPKA